VDPDVADGLYDAVKLGFTRDGTMSAEAMRDNVRTAAVGTDADPNTDPSVAFDFSIAHEIAAERQRQ
jgi:hypothetical protein